MKSIAVATSSACASEGGIAFAFSVGATSVRRTSTSWMSRFGSRPAFSASASDCLPKGSSAARLPEVYLSQVSFCCAVRSRISRTRATRTSSPASPCAASGTEISGSRW